MSDAGNFVCVGPPGTFTPIQLHVGPDPMPADAGWICTFHPADESGAPWEVLHKLYQAARLLRKIP